MAHIAQFLLEIRQRLTKVSETPGLDAQVYLAHLLGVSRAWILAHPEAPLTSEQSRKAYDDLVRMEAGLPLPYILGSWEFYGREFVVTPDVLIPRPETEILVERALGWLLKRPGRRLAADVGTGSGCIAVSLAARIPGLQVLALDLSLPALQVARDNARRNQVAQQVLFVQADLLAAISRPVDLICANLPYIPTSTLGNLSVGSYEPVLALNGGADGLQQIRRLLQAAPGRLAKGGAIMLEIEAGQGPAVLALGRQAFPDARIELYSDLAGHDRLVEILNPEQSVDYSL